MNTTNTNTADSRTETAKAVEAFYMRAGERGTPVSLWINRVTTKGAPDFDGTIGEQRVALRIRSGANGSFLAVTRSLKQSEVKEDGFKEAQIGTANVIVNDRGIPVLAIKLDSNPGKTVWATASLKAPQDLLVQCGLDLEILKQKKAEYAAHKTAAEAKEAVAA